MNGSYSKQFIPFVLLIWLAANCASHAQGSLTPPGNPAPTMKSLQQIWDQVAVLDARNQALEQQILSLRQTNREQSSFLAALLEANSVTLPWKITTVDSQGDAGRYCSLAMSPSGQPAIAYIGEGQVKYAVYNGSGWQITGIDSAFVVGSLAFSPNGQPAIAYSGEVLKYAVLDGGTWQISSIGSGAAVPGGMAFTQDGKPAVAYIYLYNQLKYAVYDESSWQSSLILSVSPEQGGIVSTSPLVFSKAGEPTIAVSVWDAFGGAVFLEVYQYNGLGWNSLIHSGAATASIIGDLVLTPEGHLLLSQQQEYPVELAYRVWNGSGWQYSAIQGTTTSTGGDAAFSPSGKLAFSNHVPIEDDLTYLAYDGTTWQISTVDSAGNVGSYNSLAFNSAGQPAIAYYDKTNKDLKFAVREPYTKP